MNMSRASRIAAFVMAIAFVTVGAIIMIQRVGAIIGWDKAWSDWPIIMVLIGLILFVALLIYMSVRNKLNR
jgi:cytochrome bd-type quinol oxidase subunit 2